MHGNRKKNPREKDLTSRYLSGDFEEESLQSQERASRRSADGQQEKMERTSAMRAGGQAFADDIESLPTGQVVQVYSLFCDVECAGRIVQCVVRKTLNKVSDSALVVGDFVRFREGSTVGEGVVEQGLPRKTVLTRADSFKAREQQPIVANAEQMLVVASLLNPWVKWGLIDRMIAAAQSGGLRPVVCLNKIDLAGDLPAAREVLGHYRSMGVGTLETSAEARIGLDELREVLKDRTTVVAGHSGVGKSTLINSIQPLLNLRVGAISSFNDKGRHTTTSAKRYVLDFGGQVIDTPGVKLFGLWGVTKENVMELFPDVENKTAPEWRVESYRRIVESLGG